MLETNPFGFEQCIRTWLFMKVLERERELAQRQVLLNRWTAYDDESKMRVRAAGFRWRR